MDSISRTDGVTSGWIAIADRLPPIELPVWLYVPGITSPFIGVRTLDDGHWFWARCYDSHYWSNKSAADGKPGWEAYTADVDDLSPTHWHYLPEPPTNS